jgi:peptidoglycan-associated lipoprotein
MQQADKEPGMSKKLIRMMAMAATLAVLGACSSTPPQEQSPAGVEDRQGSPNPGAQTQPIPGSGIARVDIPPKGGAIRGDHNNPASILSKRSIFYDLDKYDVKEEYRGLVEAHAKYLRENPGLKIMIQGNTDERGSREYNLALGQRRSDGVKRMMGLLGVKEDQLEAVSLGEEKPRAPGSSEEAWAQNRRCDILYTGEF